MHANCDFFAVQHIRLAKTMRLYRDSVTRFFASGFFHEAVSPQPQSIPCGDIRKSRCTTGLNDTGGKFATGDNNTFGNFAAGINDTGGKFAIGINDRQILPPVSIVFLIPVANLPPVSTILEANLPSVSKTPEAN
jgi:hypothetical protein